MRKNLGMLVLAIPLGLVGLALAQATEVGVYVVLFAVVVALVSIVKVGLELMNGPKPVETSESPESP